jgi:polyphosphate kinase 2
MSEKTTPKEIELTRDDAPTSIESPENESSNQGAQPPGAVDLEDEGLEEEGLEEEELLAIDDDDDDDDDDSGPDIEAIESAKENGTILVPKISPRGVTIERLKGKRQRMASRVELIEVKDDRVGKLEKLGRNHYLQLIMPLHVELLKLQNYVKEKRLRVVVLFEGRDAAGKGGTIKRFIEHMNPRGCRVVALDKPTDEERGQWYFQRYVKHLPTAGEIVLFDRSWYNRAMVERVMGFCKDDEVREFLRSAPEFERMLNRSGISLLKYYFSVSKKEQLRRFQKRLNDPLKQWKLSPVDLESQDKWDEYKRSKEDMFFYTSTADSPWVIIKSDEKKRARINAIRHFLERFNYPKDYPHMLGCDPRIVKTVNEELASDS